MMRRIMGVIVLGLLTFPALCQTTSKYQVGTIMAVKTHPVEGSHNSDVTSYDVSLKVGDTIFVTLYTPPLGQDNVKYALGRDLLVLVGEKTITYNDILGRSFEVPIESQKPVTKAKQPKPVATARE